MDHCGSANGFDEADFDESGSTVIPDNHGQVIIGDRDRDCIAESMTDLVVRNAVNGG